MILVLCLNAAVDKTVELDRLGLRRLNRPRRVFTLAGGKGINVGRVLTKLGEEPKVLGFVAGYTGAFIERAVAEEGIQASWVRLERGRSRTCLAILHGRGAPTELNEAGAPVSRADFARLLERYRALARKSSLVIASGSLPPGCPAAAYARLVREARNLGRPVFVDTSGPALKHAIAARPHLLKLNRAEAASLGMTDRRPAALARALESLAARGPRHCIATLGPAGAVAYLGGRRLLVRPPRVHALSPVGCGDTFLAGLARELLAGRAPERALAYATALATASALVPGAGVVRLRDVGPLLARTRVSAL